MSEQHYGEKYEKEREKEEKEREKDEKTWDEKWHRDPLGSAVWALVLIWVGVVLLATNMNVFTELDWFDAWGAILAGAGVLLLLEVLGRLLVPAYRRPVVGTTILGVFLLGSGLSNLFETSSSLTMGLILVVIGVIVLVRGVTGRS